MLHRHMYTPWFVRPSLVCNCMHVPNAFWLLRGSLFSRSNSTGQQAHLLGSHWTKCFSFQQLWTVALWLLQAMAKLVTVVGQHLDRQLTTAVIQATTWEGRVLAHAKIQNCGLGVNLPVHVCHYCMTFKWWYVYMMHLPLSTAVDCGTLTNPANGQVNHTAGSTFRQTATYSCNAGYNLVGGSSRVCQATGVWSGSAPSCQCMLLLQTVKLELTQLK